MNDDKPLKSAYELAMERLRAKDEEEGIEQARPLTDEQRREIGRLRDEARAKLAEREILHKKDLVAAQGDPDKTKDLEEKYRIDRARIESRLETAVARIRRGKKGGAE